MGSSNSDSYAAMASLIIAWIAAEFGSPVIELSKVGLITRAPLMPVTPTGDPSLPTAVASRSSADAASARTSVDATLTWSNRPTPNGMPAA